jgi:hypothetical protein
VGSDNLSSRFDDNLGSDSKDWYPEGPLTLLSAVSGPGPGPREFYHADRPAGVTPYLYDPSQGNLLLDWIAWQGASPSPRADWITGMQTALVGSPFATHGSFIPVIVHQFTFIPVPEPSSLTLLAVLLVLGLLCRRATTTKSWSSMPRTT